MHVLYRMTYSDQEAAKRKLDRGLVRRVGHYAKPYQGMLIGFLVTIVLEALLSLAPPLLFKAIVDNAIADKDTGYLTQLAALVVAAAVGVSLLGLAERYWSARIGEGLIYDLRSELFDHVQRLPMAFFTRTQTGSLVSRLNNDVIGAQRAFTGTLGTVVSNVITVVVTLAAMARLEWRLTIASVLLLPLFIWPAKRVGKRLATITRDGMQENAEMNNIMTERFGVSGAMLVKTYGNEQRELTEFSGRAAKVRDIGVKSAMLTRIFLSVMGLVGAMGTAAIYWWGGRQVINGVITLGTLTALAALVVRIYEPLTSLTNARIDVMSAFVSFERVFEVLDTPTPIQDAAQPVDLGRAKGRIEFDDVTFHYPAASDTSVASLEGNFAPQTDELATVLHGVTATIEPGQMVALVARRVPESRRCRRWSPGCTTSARSDPRRRHRRARHLPREPAELDRHRRPGPHMFHTVGENLPTPGPARPIPSAGACKAAQVLDVIERLPDGFDTVVGERGYRLSGGEKQRLAIARMLVKDPAIVILDEATSHLDSENEHLVQMALATALADRTSIVIAHRLSTITAADQILVMDSGRIVQRGTHDTLVTAGGLYTDLYRTLTGPTA